jgi:hypothetical protein
MKNTHNERNAGRKPKYIGKIKLKTIPVDSEDKVDEVLKPYLFKNNIK